ncbi:hypothetical protein KJ678_04290 [Patescibacteria group bacterium]|nr:hypothetical protein [Patescibacteria group bacterium]
MNDERTPRRQKHLALAQNMSADTRLLDSIRENWRKLLEWLQGKEGRLLPTDEAEETRLQETDSYPILKE